MKKEYRRVLIRMDQLHLLRRMIHQRLMADLPLYRGQPPVLDYIYHNPGCTQIELAQRLMVSPASIAQSTQRMERAGFLERRQDADNRRCKRLYLTQEGEELNQRCRMLFDETDEKMFQGFSAREKEELENYLQRLLSNIAPIAQVDLENMDKFTYFALLNQMKSEAIRKERGDA